MVRTTLIVDSGETISVASGDTKDSTDTQNAGTVSNAGTYESGEQNPLVSADVDQSTATAIRVRDLIATAADVDAATASATRVRDLTAAAEDVDTALVALTRIRDLLADAADVDAAIGTVTRVRALTITATDVDEGIFDPERVRLLTAEGNDVDELLLGRVTVRGIDDAVEVVRTILAETRTITYSRTKPDVRLWWDDAQSERGPGADQPPIVYVWSPTGSSLDRFSMDTDHYDRNDTVEVQVWSLDEREARRIQSDITGILSQYLDDNAVTTPYSDMAPVTENDYREQNPARKTDHYVMSVEIETRGLDPAEPNA